VRGGSALTGARRPASTRTAAWSLSSGGWARVGPPGPRSYQGAWCGICSPSRPGTDVLGAGSRLGC